MRLRLLVLAIIALMLAVGVQKSLAAPPRQGTGTATTTPTTMPTTSGTATATATAVPATAIPTPTTVPTAAPTFRVTAELLPNPPGVMGAFTVAFTSSAPGQGEIYFGTGPGCMGLVEMATQDQHAGTTSHVVTVTHNEMPGTVGDSGLQPGVTYWFETVTVTRSGPIIDNNGGKCYSVTIPKTPTVTSLRVLTTRMTGAQETPPTGVAGMGAATITVDASTNQVCWTLSATGITLPAIAAHIHQAPVGTPGPIVVPLSPPGATGTSSGCTTAPAAIVLGLLTNPSAFYVNVHTTDFPAGAIRGQLG